MDNTFPPPSFVLIPLDSLPLSLATEEHIRENGPMDVNVGSSLHENPLYLDINSNLIINRQKVRA